MTDPDSVREVVRARYAEAAARVLRGEPVETRPRGASCCIGGAEAASGSARVFGSDLYDLEAADGATEGALPASLGCGVPTAVADLHPGEVVLDLGSGAGADVLISARRVKPGGRVIGLDMTEQMLELAIPSTANASSLYCCSKRRWRELNMWAHHVPVVVVGLQVQRVGVGQQLGQLPGGSLALFLLDPDLDSGHPNLLI